MTSEPMYNHHIKEKEWCQPDHNACPNYRLLESVVAIRFIFNFVLPIIPYSVHGDLIPSNMQSKHWNLECSLHLT